MIKIQKRITILNDYMNIFKKTRNFGNFTILQIYKNLTFSYFYKYY